MGAIFQSIKYHVIYILLSAYILGIVAASKSLAILLTIALLCAFLAIYFFLKKQTQYLLLTCLVFSLVIFGGLRTHSILNSQFIEAKNTKINALIIDEPSLKRNKYRFLVKSQSKDTKGLTFIATINKKYLATKPKYGALVALAGEIKPPSYPTNPGQFDYGSYLKQKGVAGLFKLKSLKVIEPRFGNPFKRLAYYLKKKILAINNQTLPYPYSDLYTGLVFGDHGTQLPDDMSDNFQKVGLMHLLVVSGSQVALLSGILLSIFRIFQCSNNITYILVTASNILFYFITGGGASIFRAVLMSQVALGIKMLKRNSDIYHIIACTALIMLLLNPISLFNLGAQLSFIATFALLFGVPKITSLFPENWPKLIKETLSVSLAPFIFTTPLIWYAFQNISPISILSNLIVINWIEFLVVVGFFSTVIGFVLLPLTQIINNFCLVVMIILDKLVSFLANIPFSVIYITKPSILVVLILYVLIIFVLNAIQFKKTKKLVYAFIAFLLLLFLLLLPSLLPSKYMKVTFIDVGQGDSILIETPNKRTILIDAGDLKRDFKTGAVVSDAGKNIVMPILNYKGINKLDLLISTHFHNDHIGGVPYILSNIVVGTALDNGGYHKHCQNYYDVIKKKAIKRVAVRAGQAIKLDKSVTLNILYPINPDTTPKNYFEDNENNNSIVVKLSYKDIDFLFTGDLEHEKEEALVSLYQEKLNSEVLKLGHHGSNTSSSEEFIDTVSPIFGIVSVGKKNKFRHPSKKTLARFHNRKIKTIRTDKKGAIEFLTNGKILFYKTWGS